VSDVIVKETAREHNGRVSHSSGPKISDA